MKGFSMTIWQGLDDNVSLVVYSVRESLMIDRIGRV